MDTKIYPRWNGKLLIPSKTADLEMAYEDLDLWQLKELLEISRPCGKRRRTGITEICTEKGKRSYKIVLAESFQFSSRELIFLVIHVKSVSR